MGRRFYRPQDLEVLRGVRVLLQDEGYTIRGVQKLHKEQGLKRLLAAAGLNAAVIDLAEEHESDTPSDTSPSDASALADGADELSAPLPTDEADDEPRTGDLFASAASFRSPAARSHAAARSPSRRWAARCSTPPPARG